jgi:signal transduction histidine kinase
VARSWGTLGSGQPLATSMSSLELTADHRWPHGHIVRHAAECGVQGIVQALPGVFQPNAPQVSGRAPPIGKVTTRCRAYGMRVLAVTDERRLRSQGTVGLRLALAFVAVAVLAVALVAVLAVLFTDRDISALIQQRGTDLTNSLAADAVSTYNTGKPGWYDVDLPPALKLAESDGAQAAVLDDRGRVVASMLTDPRNLSGTTRRPLTSGGQRIGTLLVRFTGQGLTASAYNLRASLVRAVIGAAGLAAVLALLAAVLVSRRITRPVTLHEEIKRLGRMVEDLQTLAAAEAAALQLSRQPCDLAEIAAEEADDWDASFAAAGVSFTRRLEPAPVLADPLRLHQVITNLLSNALKFTLPGGQVRISLSADGGQARLEVSDTCSTLWRRFFTWESTVRS